MSAMGGAADITLAELERLIKLLGLLASTHDGEALNAGRLAAKWVAEKGTDWQTLLVPEPLPAVVEVVAPKDPDLLAEAYEADRVAAFKNGYQAGLRDMAAQLKAQAAFVAGQGSAVHGAGGFAGPGQGATAPNAPGGPPAASGGPAHVASGGRVWPAGSWQAIAQALLDRHAQGIPGVLRSREEAFVADILQRGFPSLTQAQEDWLRAIAARSAMTW